MLKTSTHMKGPFFDGRTKKTVSEFRTHAQRDIANSARDMIRRELLVVPKFPTGYYRRHISVLKKGSAYTVHDSGVVYGPWLEGVSERNRTTRFKGYSFFRRAWQRFNKAAGPIAEQILRQYVGRM